MAAIGELKQNHSSSGADPVSVDSSTECARGHKTKQDGTAVWKQQKSNSETCLEVPKQMLSAAEITMCLAKRVLCLQACRAGVRGLLSLLNLQRCWGEGG